MTKPRSDATPEVRVERASAASAAPPSATRTNRPAVLCARRPRRDPSAILEDVRIDRAQSGANSIPRSIVTIPSNTMTHCVAGGSVTASRPAKEVPPLYTTAARAARKLATLPNVATEAIAIGQLVGLPLGLACFTEFAVSPALRFPPSDIDGPPKPRKGIGPSSVPSMYSDGVEPTELTWSIIPEKMAENSYSADVLGCLWKQKWRPSRNRIDRLVI